MSATSNYTSVHILFGPPPLVDRDTSTPVEQRDAIGRVIFDLDLKCSTELRLLAVHTTIVEKGERLASTLGGASASSFRKLSKRDIVSVDVRKSCETVANPQQPLALRTSSHLMYGVVRVYTKQTEYWISDVRASYTSIRKLIMQSANGRITTLSGLQIVGQDTATIDLPNRERDMANLLTLPAQNGLYGYNLHLDAGWFDGADPLTTDGALSSLNDSLSMFGSSIYNAAGGGSERGRQGSFELGMDLLSPVRDQPFTADPSAIHRSVAADPLQLQRRDPLDFEPFGLDDLDLPPLPHDDGVQLDLNLDDPSAALQGLDQNVMHDDQLGFDLTDFGENQVSESVSAIRVNELFFDGPTKPHEHRPPSPSADEDTRPSKRPRNAIEDNFIELSDGQIRNRISGYVSTMAQLRLKSALRRLAKEAEQQVQPLVFGPNADLCQAPMLAQFWTLGIDAGLLLSHHGQDHAASARAGVGALEGDYPQDEQLPMQFDDDMPMPPLEGEQGPDAGQKRADSPGWESEIGRAGQSDPLDLPWNRARDGIRGAGEMDETMAGDTTIGVSTRSFSIETPTGLRRPERRSLMSGRASVDLPYRQDDDDQGVEPADQSGQMQESPMLVEQEMVKFHAYAWAINDAQEGQPLFFSDLAPVADTSVGDEQEVLPSHIDNFADQILHMLPSQPGVAARAFYHILSLTTADRLSVEQREAYGDIHIKFA